MPNGYTLLWSKDRWTQVKAQANPTESLNILFGGPHQSEPAFHKFGVKEGDDIYPVTVSAGVLYVLGRMRVKRLLSIDEYIVENAAAFAGYESKFGGEATFGSWQKDHPEQRYLAPTCTNEVALGTGTPLGMTVAVPPEELEKLHFCSQKGERPIKHIVDGRLKSIVSLQGGTYRLTEPSARRLDSILASASKIV